MFSKFIKTNAEQNSKLSAFVIDSSSSEKKRVYNQVIKRAISSQVQVVKKAASNN